METLGVAGSAADGGNAGPRYIRFGVDSGACTTIIGKNVCVDYPLMHSGLNFRAANGIPFPALGKKEGVEHRGWKKDASSGR